MEQSEQGLKVFVQVDPLIEKFFKETTQGLSHASWKHWGVYKYQHLDGMPEEFYYHFQRSNSMYYSNRVNLCPLSLNLSAKEGMSMGIVFDGLIDDTTIKNYQKDFIEKTKEFVNEIIKPYYYTKKYISKKEGTKMDGLFVINKEGYKKAWYSYFKNYKRFILPKEVKAK